MCHSRYIRVTCGRFLNGVRGVNVTLVAAARGGCVFFLLCMGLTTIIRGVVPSGWAGCFMLRAMGCFNRSLLRFCPAFHIAIFDVWLNCFY